MPFYALERKLKFFGDSNHELLVNADILYSISLGVGIREKGPLL